MKNKLISVLGILFIALIVIGWNLSSRILNLILSFVPKEIQIIALNPMEVFITSLSIAILFAILISLPFVLFVLIRYVTPALYPKEKSILRKILSTGTILFIFGFSMSFIGFVTFGLKWFAEFNVKYGFQTLWSLQQTIDSILMISLLSGLIFEFPIVLYYLIKHNVFSFKLNIQSRLSLLLGLLIVIGIITPDGSIFTQSFMTFPIYGLIELSIWLGNKNSMEVRT